MIKARNLCKLSASISRYMVSAAAAANLLACKPDVSEQDEIFIEAIPTMSSSLAIHSIKDKKPETSQPIQLGFDNNAYFASEISSFLYRGEYPTYVHDQGHFKPGSVLVDNRTSWWQGPILTLPPLAEGVTYNASLWVRLIDTDQPARAKLVLTRVSDGAVTSLVLKEMQVEPRVWQNVEGEFVGHADSDNDINAISLEVESADKYLLDDITFIPAHLSEKLQVQTPMAKPKVRDFISNGDVEEGLEPWTNQGGIISRNTSFAHTGKHSLLISGRRQEWNGPMMYVKGLDDNKVYRFSIFVRLQEGLHSADMKMTLRRTTAGQTSFMPVANGRATSVNWTEIAGTFSAPNISESEKVSVYVECEDPVASFFVDTLTVEQIPD